MAVKNIEIQDDTGNIYYPHTDASVVKCKNGGSVETQLDDMLIHTTLKLNKDNNDIFTEVQHKRQDGTLILKSVLSGGISPKYNIRTITKYTSNGTIEWTKTYALNYDSNDILVSEMIS